MRKKIDSYFGFARKSRNLVMGTNTCVVYMQKNKLKLLIIGKDIGENTSEKLISMAEGKGIEYRRYSTSDELSEMAGTSGRGVFGITDNNFAKVILEEIDKEEKEVLHNENK